MGEEGRREGKAARAGGKELSLFSCEDPVGAIDRFRRTVAAPTRRNQGFGTLSPRLNTVIWYPQPANHHRDRATERPSDAGTQRPSERSTRRPSVLPGVTMRLGFLNILQLRLLPAIAGQRSRCQLPPPNTIRQNAIDRFIITVAAPPATQYKDLVPSARDSTQ